MGTRTTELEQLKARIAATPRTAQGHRDYDDALRGDVRTYAQERTRAGQSHTSIAEDLGISGDTLWGWLNKVGLKGRGGPRSLPERAKEFRACLAALGPRTATMPYPPELRALGVKHLKERRAQGATQREVANELGIANDTLRKWSRGRERVRSAVRPVRIATSSATTAPSLVVHGPAGIRIEGLDVATVAALLKVLS